eukprot:TRINITY_DN5764_c0_g1_i1.p1 TRINITY_DN5764_c0_g1~~TRINITY_DN5764_c0_g1_i1.p1  ORF type:complete len:133 (-),score=30.97 TRINITY_DN5764_c0_g1_i1:173-571(-)
MGKEAETSLVAQVIVALAFGGLLLLVAALTLLLRSKQVNNKRGGRLNGREESSATNRAKGRVISKAEVAQHSARNDCWIIIKQKVYDVSMYVDEHPGGDAILANAGHSIQLVFLTSLRIFALEKSQRNDALL